MASLVPALLAAALMLTSCAQPTDSTSAGTASAQPVAEAAPTSVEPSAQDDATQGASAQDDAPQGASAQADAPSEQAEIVCRPEAQEDIEELLGVEPTQVGPLQYANHLSTCRYAYPDGAFTLSVQDLPSDITTTRAYDALATKLGRVEAIDLPDAAAFTTKDGSVVLRKDTRVMLVDVTQLPAMFGEPPSSRADAARLIMKAILGCWTG